MIPTGGVSQLSGCCPPYGYHFIMQKVLLKNGFQETGIIYVEDGTPRIAYEKVK